MLATAQKKWRIAYRNRLSDWFDKWLFFVAFITGVVGIVVLKLWNLSQGVVTAFPLLVMVLYAIYVFASRRYRLREDMAGDGLYYLGFLYTLTSLAYALYAFAQDEGNTQVVISNFGIALATTIVGMALRVLFNQMREDPVEIEREARMELSEAVVKLKIELDHTVLELNSFRRATVQSVDEGQREMQAKISKAMADSITLYEEMAQEIVSKLTEVQAKVDTTLTTSVTRFAEVEREVVGKVESAFTGFAKYPSMLNESTKKTATATMRLIERVERMEIPPDLLEKKFTPAIERLLTCIQQMTDEYTQAFAPQLKSLIASMQKAIEGANVQTAQVALLRQILDTAAKSAQSLEEHLTTWRTKDEQRAAAMGSELELLRLTVATFRGEAEQNGQLLSKLSQEAEAELGAVHTHRQALEAELSTSRKLVSEMHTALVSMASLVVEKLNGS
jgi:hypothetical protein